MEHRRLVGEATNLMLNFAKDPKLAKYMSKTAFQDVQAQLKATTTSPPKPDSKKQYSEKELEEEIDARLARILGAQKQGKKRDRKRKKSTDFPGYLGSQSTFDKAKKHKKRAAVPSSSSFDSSSESSEEERRSKKRSKRHRHGKGKRKTRKSRSRRADDSFTEESSTDSSDSEDGHFYANKKNFYKANQYDFVEDKSKKVREFKEGGQSIKFETFLDYKALSFIQQFDIAFAGGRYSEHSKIRRAASYFKGNARTWWSTLLYFSFTCGRAGIYALGAAAAKLIGDEQRQDFYLNSFTQIANSADLAVGPDGGTLNYAGTHYRCYPCSRTSGCLSSWILSSWIVSFDVSVAWHKTGNYPSSEGNTKDRLVQWCHGAAGIGLTMCKAAEVFPTVGEFKDAAVDAGEVVWRRGLLRKAGLCHGVSGNASLFLALYRLTGDERHLHRAKAFSNFMYELGLNLISTGQMHGGDHPFSLLEGSAGIACLWLDVLRPEHARFPGYEL
ncbi:hypothetical protein L7F22_016121 [Adiantum nelumboides]|nr:hypothetical protein [Adiantum nelumboides]